MKNIRIKYCSRGLLVVLFFFCQAEDGIRDDLVTGVQTCALPICPAGDRAHPADPRDERDRQQGRSEAHTSELQSPDHLVCRLLLDKKKTILLPIITEVLTTELHESQYVDTLP